MCANPGQGLVYKKGKFSATEDQQLNDAIERYRVVSSGRLSTRVLVLKAMPQTHGLSQEDLDQIIFSNKSGKDKGHESFWSEISRYCLADDYELSLTYEGSVCIASAPHHRGLPSC